MSKKPWWEQFRLKEDWPFIFIAIALLAVFGVIIILP